MTPDQPPQPSPPDELPDVVSAVGGAARRAVFLRHDRGVRAARQHLRPRSASATTATRRATACSPSSSPSSCSAAGRWCCTTTSGRGLRAFAGRDEQRLKEMVALANRKVGDLSALPKDPAATFALLDRFVRNNIMAAEDDRLSLAVIMDQASYVFPAGEPGRLNLQASSQLVTMLNWAMSPHVKRLNMAFVLVDEKLADLSDRLDRQPARRDDRGAAAGRAGARGVHHGRRPATRRSTDFSDFDAARAGQADRRHLADRSQRADPVGARERQAARRDGVPRAEEAAARAAVPRAARVHRAEVDARHRRRPRGGEGAAARGRGAAQARRARHACRWAICSAARSAPASRSSRSASAARSACRA